MVTILYRPESEHERAVLDFQRELVRAQTVVKLVNIDSREGGVIARLYDVARYPGVVITEEDGRILKLWQGELPPVKEVSFRS